jgi:hypothetical protein
LSNFYFGYQGDGAKADQINALLEMAFCCQTALLLSRSLPPSSYSLSKNPLERT